MTKENVAAGEGTPRLALSVCPSPPLEGRGGDAHRLERPVTAPPSLECNTRICPAVNQEPPNPTQPPPHPTKKMLCALSAVCPFLHKRFRPSDKDAASELLCLVEKVKLKRNKLTDFWFDLSKLQLGIFILTLAEKKGNSFLIKGGKQVPVLPR